MAWQVNPNSGDYEYVSGDMLFDGLTIAQENGDRFLVAMIGITAMSLEQLTDDDEAPVFTSVWEAAHTLLSWMDNARQQG